MTWVITVREDRRDTEDSLVCRVFLDHRYVQYQPTHTRFKIKMCERCNNQLKRYVVNVETTEDHG